MSVEIETPEVVETAPVVETPVPTPEVANTPPVEETPQEYARLSVNEEMSPEVVSILNVANTLLPNVDLQRVFGEAIETGDSSAIDVNHLREVLGDSAEDIVKVMAGVVDSIGSTVEGAFNEVYEKVGGAEQWANHREVFLANCTPNERAFVASLTNSRNPAKIKEGADYVIKYSQRMGGASVTPRSISTGTGGAGGMGLSREEYQQAYRELSNDPKYRSNPTAYAEAVENLDQQRALGMKYGK